MKIYTKTGDKGETSLVYGQRVSKTDERVEAYGTCDEANSFIGFSVSLLDNNHQWEPLKKGLHFIQTKLFHVGAELSTPVDKKVQWPITEDDVRYLEEQIDLLDAELLPLMNFILPGGHPAGANLHIARTVVRRAERRALAIKEEINPLTIQYLNRLSDYLFIAARWVNFRSAQEEQGLHS